MPQTIFDQLRDRIGWLQPPPSPPKLGLVLSGGGARGAYQAGVLCYIAETFDTFHPRILTGVSAGAINAVHLASCPYDTFRETVGKLRSLWEVVSPEKIFESDSGIGLLWKVLRRAPVAGPEADLQLVTAMHGLFHTSPLREFLYEHLPSVDEDGVVTGIGENIRRGYIESLAIMTANYTTGQTNAWVQGADLPTWDRPMRRSIQARISVEHVMASSALPLFFPAVRLGDSWHGDGGVRLTAPLAPALHLGADRILVISTRHQDTEEEANDVEFLGYPPTAQIIGILMNAVFLDMLDQDVLTLERINTLVESLPRNRRMGLRSVHAHVIRPSVNLAEIAGDFEPHVSTSFKLFMRMIGSSETKSPRWLSMLNFDSEYIARCLETGYEDARNQSDGIEAFLAGEPVPSTNGR